MLSNIQQLEHDIYAYTTSQINLQDRPDSWHKWYLIRSSAIEEVILLMDQTLKGSSHD